MPLSQKQMEYLALAWQCFDAEPKIDYDKFKEVAGLASAASARELMRVTKKKLKEEYGALSGGIRAANGGDSPVKKSAPRTPAKRGRSGAKKSAAENGDAKAEDEDDEENTPVTKRAKTPVSKKKTNGIKAEPVVEAGSDDDGEYLL